MSTIAVVVLGLAIPLFAPAVYLTKKVERLLLEYVALQATEEALKGAEVTWDFLSANYKSTARRYIGEVDGLTLAEARGLLSLMREPYLAARPGKEDEWEMIYRDAQRTIPPAPGIPGVVVFALPVVAFIETALIIWGAARMTPEHCSEIRCSSLLARLGYAVAVAGGLAFTTGFLVVRIVKGIKASVLLKRTIRSMYGPQMVS